jgi:hypothetical protein
LPDEFVLALGAGELDLVLVASDVAAARRLPV